MNAAKPGWQTSEFWLNLAAVLVVYLLSADLGISEDSWFAKGLTIAVTILAAMGYTAGRTVVKRELIRANGTTISRDPTTSPKP